MHIDVSIDATMGAVRWVPDLLPETSLAPTVEFSPAEVAIFNRLDSFIGNIYGDGILSITLCHR
jgi:hypothetical protein